MLRPLLLQLICWILGGRCRQHPVQRRLAHPPMRSQRRLFQVTTARLQVTATVLPPLRTTRLRTNPHRHFKRVLRWHRHHRLWEVVNLFQPKVLQAITLVPPHPPTQVRRPYHQSPPQLPIIAGQDRMPQPRTSWEVKHSPVTYLVCNLHQEMTHSPPNPQPLRLTTTLRTRYVWRQRDINRSLYGIQP